MTNQTCKTCGDAIPLQGVGTYFENGESVGIKRYFYCSKCKDWTSVIDKREIVLGESHEF